MMTERKLRSVAKENGYILHKGFVHYLPGDCVFYDRNGERTAGYSLLDIDTGLYHPDSYNEVLDNLLSLEDVERILVG